MTEITKTLMNVEEIQRMLLHTILPKIIGALLLFVIGVWVTRLLRRFIRKLMLRREIDPTVQVFVNQLLRWIFYIILFLAIIQILGVPTSSFLGALTASAVAIGLALQGSLSNFAGGIMLLILKPFKIGDFIKAKGEIGEVQRIGMFYTQIIKSGNEIVSIPNGPLFSDTITNYSSQKTRQAIISISISNTSDSKNIRDILLQIAKNHPLTIQTPEPTILIEEVSDKSITLSFKIWALTEHYTSMYHSIIEDIKNEFEEKNIVFLSIK